MIGYIKGKVMQIKENCLLIENGGIGYEVTCSASALSSMTERGEGGIYTYLQVKEDGVSLYGFISAEEKETFLKLISVSGVGPKMGIAVLSGMRMQDLAMAIATGDVKALSRVKGLGKKTAERIILELKESVSSDLGERESAGGYIQPAEGGMEEDALIALMSLGFTRSEAIKAVSSAKQSGASSLEELIAASIRMVR